MGITSSNRQINVNQINCDGSIKVTMALSAAPDILSNPTDIVLILDKSGSMAGIPFENMKNGANTFIDIIDKSTDSNQDGNIGSGSHIGIVSFSDVAEINSQLTTSVSDLKPAVNSLNSGGFTNHGDAFEKAMEIFNPLSQNKKIIIMFTDGKTTVGIDPTPIAENAKSMGITIYCIGLMGSNGIDINILNQWATDPDISHVVVTPNSEDLEELFAELASNISKTGATNIFIEETINPNFIITGIPTTTKGTAIISGDNKIKWQIGNLGVTENESAFLEYFIKHNNYNSGLKQVSQSTKYYDKEGNKVIFPNPSVLVNCDVIVNPEPCPVANNIKINECKDFVSVNMDNVIMESLGRIVELNLKIKNVCPKKRIALAVILKEIDKSGNEYSRGLKTITIPAHNYHMCKDVMVKNIRFVLPEDLNVNSTNPNSICSERNLKASFIVNYIDSDFKC